MELSDQGDRSSHSSVRGAKTDEVKSDDLYRALDEIMQRHAATLKLLAEH